MCTDVIRISRGTDSTLTLDIRPSISLASKQKRLHFETVEQATRFQEYVEYRNDYGACVRAAFNKVDMKSTGAISRGTLQAALVAEDLQPTDEDISNMFVVATTEDKGVVNFLQFFHVFLGTPVYTIRSCLQEWLQRARYQHRDGSVKRRPDSTAFSLLSGSGVRLVQGEVISSVELNLRWMIGAGRGHQEASTSTAGALLLTNYRICLISNKCLFSETTDGQRSVHSRHDRPFVFDVLQIPLNTLQKVYLVGVGIGQYRRELMLATKDLRLIRLAFPLSEHSLSKEEGLNQLIQKMAFPGNKSDLFAFHYGSSCVSPPSSPSPSTPTWQPSDMRAEYARQGLTTLSSQWKVHRSASLHVLCNMCFWSLFTDVYCLRRYSTIQTTLCARLTLHMLSWRLGSATQSCVRLLSSVVSAAFPALPTAIRTGECSEYTVVLLCVDSPPHHISLILHRITSPILPMWCDNSGAVLTRSAQPMVGITGKSSKTDQNLLYYYRLHGRNVDEK